MNARDPEREASSTNLPTRGWLCTAVPPHGRRDPPGAPGLAQHASPGVLFDVWLPGSALLLERIYTYV